MTTDQPLDLDAIETRANAATDGPWERYEKYGPDFFACTTGSYLRGVGSFNFGDGTDADADEEFVKHAVQDVRALVAEVRRLRAELAAAPGQAIAWAADIVDEKLTTEPDHNRASALYEVLLHLRGELPCTCARSQGLHERACRKYVPGHELLSPVRALDAYRAEPAAAGSAAANEEQR